MLDLSKQGGYPSRVARSTRCQIRRDDLTRVGVDGEVQLSPGSLPRWFSQMTDVNPETGAVDEQMDRSIVLEHAKREFTELLEAPGQSRMVGNGDLYLEHLDQGTKEALSLSERKVEDHADRQGRFNRDVRVGALAAGLPAG